MNRNHYMAFGTVLLLLGLTVYRVEAVTLSQESTHFIAQQLEETPADTLVAASPMKKTIKIPPWVCFAIISLGAVMMLHAVGMAKS